RRRAPARLRDHGSSIDLHSRSRHGGHWIPRCDRVHPMDSAIQPAPRPRRRRNMMKRHTVTLSALILAAVALVGCSAEPTPPAAVPAPESTQAAPSPTPPETEAVACPYFLAKIHFGNMTAKINGK